MTEPFDSAPPRRVALFSGGEAVGDGAALPVRGGFAKSAANTTTAGLAAGATYTGTWESITAYQQVVVTVFGRPSVFQGDANTAVGTLIFEFSNDGGVTTDVMVPVLVDDPGYVIPVPLIPVGTHFRVRYLNDGGAFLGYTFTARTLTTFRLTSLLFTVATKEITRTLDQEIRGNQPVVLTRGVVMGLNPDSDYQNERVSGTLTLSPTPAALAGGAVYTSDWLDASGFESIMCNIVADQASATNGIDVQYSNDAGVSIDGHNFRTFAASDVTTGSKAFQAGTRGDWIRLVYTNSGTAQTVFRVHLELVKEPFAATDTIEGTINVASTAAMTRAVLAASDGSTYANIPRTGFGGLRVHLDPLNTGWQVQQAAVTGTAAQFGATPLTARKEILFMAPTSNTKIVAIGKTDTITVTTGSIPLGPGASITLPFDASITTFWAIAESGTQRLCWVEIA